MRKKISKVFLDLDGTLWEHNEKEVKELAESFNIQFDEKFKAQFYDCISTFNNIFLRKKFSTNTIKEVIQDKMPYLSKNGISANLFLERWKEIDLEVLNPHTIRLLQHLHEQEIKVIILTDWFRDVQIRKLNNHNLIQYIHRLITFEDTKHIKGNPGIDRELEELIPNFHKDSIIIGDSLKSDIAFGMRNGISSIWINPNEKDNNTIFRPTHEISDLHQILEIL